MIYFDWAATALPDDEILKLQHEISKTCWGNPSSVTEPGRKAFRKLNEAREKCAGFLKCQPDQLYFTSGGTESNNLVINSLLLKEQAGEIIAGAAEHPSAYDPLIHLKSLGWKIHFINPDKETGLIQGEEIAGKITERTKMICIMALNNETGAINPVSEISGIIQKHQKESGKKIHFHCDMVQTLGKTVVALDKCGVDSASFSGHKISAPRGIGILYLKKSLTPIFRGGGQERGFRPGTENTAGAVAFAAAMEQASIPHRHNEIYSYIAEKIRTCSGLSLVPESREKYPEHFSPSIMNICCPPLPAEVLSRTLSEEGVYVSTGSACSSRKQNKTRVIEAFSVEKKKAFSTIRISFGPSTTLKQAEEFLGILKSTVNRFKSDLNL